MLFLVTFILPVLVLTIGVQLYLEFVFGRWGRISNSGGLRGLDVAERIKAASGLQPDVVALGQPKGDHYDPQSHTVRLSQPVTDQPSVLALAVTAHELGHAQQLEQQSGLLQLRGLLLPAVSLSPTIAYGLITVGLALRLFPMVWVGIGFFAVALLFMLLTLPVEFDASQRGMKLLEQSGLLTTRQERRGVQQVLLAAGLTYVAASALSLMQFLRYIALVRR